MLANICVVWVTACYIIVYKLKKKMLELRHSVKFIIDYKFLLIFFISFNFLLSKSILSHLLLKMFKVFYIRGKFNQNKCRFTHVLFPFCLYLIHLIDAAFCSNPITIWLPIVYELYQRFILKIYWFAMSLTLRYAFKREL